ncbi:nucleoside deaminase [Deinococcus altitudinis]|uniref:nucleoside deaminase n=1 Tax=Deinococcus altitudinis TaxID=468914 RepID=UPI0038919258
MTALPAPWRAALEEAWTASLEGSLPIGACVADAQGRVLALGRNRLGEARTVDGVIGGHDLAHAEINALLALESVPRPDSYGWTVYTTVEPCPQCAGAVTMSGVRGLSYAAPDPWAGCADLLTAHPYMARKGMRVERAPAEVIRASLLLLVHALLEEGGQLGSDVMLDSFAALHPAEVERAGQLLKAGTLFKLRGRRAALDEVLTILA